MWNVLSWCIPASSSHAFLFNQPQPRGNDGQKLIIPSVVGIEPLFVKPNLEELGQVQSLQNRRTPLVCQQIQASDSSPPRDIFLAIAYHWLNADVKAEGKILQVNTHVMLCEDWCYPDASAIRENRC